METVLWLFLWLFILIFLGTVVFVITKRRSVTLSRQAASAGLNARSNNLQGVVRGFRESTQSGGYNFLRNAPDTDMIVWTFQLERHRETGERLDPIPVEMRGKSFSGFINEGNVVELYEKSWNGGIVRPWRVYNVTFKEDIKAHGG